MPFVYIFLYLWLQTLYKFVISGGLQKKVYLAHLDCEMNIRQALNESVAFKNHKIRTYKQISSVKS